MSLSAAIKKRSAATARAVARGVQRLLQRGRGRTRRGRKRRREEDAAAERARERAAERERRQRSLLARHGINPLGMHPSRRSTAYMPTLKLERFPSFDETLVEKWRD